VTSPFAQCYWTGLDLPQALQAAEKALEANPHSIFAHILVGELHEARGDLQGALAAFDSASIEFFRQYPNLHTLPAYLLQKTVKLRAESHLGR